MTTRSHWEGVYSTKRPDEMSWHQPSPERSLALIDSLGLAPDAPIIDIGAGASTLVDGLLDRGMRRVTVLDIAATALEPARNRLGARASAVEWVVGDVRADVPSGPFDLWHDRAVFHFLVDAGDRRRYVENLLGALSPNGHAIIAAFAPDGPEKCSGLPVLRHDGASLQREIGPDLDLSREFREDHVTPWGASQRFVYAVFQRRS